MQYDKQVQEDARFRGTFERAAVGIAHVSTDGIFLLVNDKLCEITGYSREQLLRMSFQEITHPGDLFQDLDYLSQLKSGKISHYSMEKRYLRSDKRYVWIYLTAWKFADGEHFVAFIEDITERKLAESNIARFQNELEERVRQRTAQLFEANESLKRENAERIAAQNERDNFFNVSLDPLIILEENGNFRRINPAFCELLGVEEVKLLAGRYGQHVHPEDTVKTEAILRKCKIKMSFKEFENRMISSDGRILWFNWAGRYVESQNCIYLSGRDVTELRARLASDKRNQATLATASKLQAVGLMAANIAHEINNPLTIVLGEGCLMQTMLAEENLPRNRLERIANNVVTMSERIVKIVNGLRNLARDGTADPLEAVGLKAIVHDTVPFSRSKIYAEAFRLEIEEIPEELKVICRPVQLSQVVLNILNNAYDAVSKIPSGGHIRIFISRAQGFINIHIRDNGPGINPRVRANLFQPFVSSKPIGQGLGLGLNVSKAIMESQNGQLYLDADSKETTFVISIPEALATTN